MSIERALERIAEAFERIAEANERIAEGWRLAEENQTARLAADNRQLDLWTLQWEQSRLDREDDLRRRDAEREADKQWALDKETRDRAGWLSSLTSGQSR